MEIRERVLTLETNDKYLVRASVKLPVGLPVRRSIVPLVTSERRDSSQCVSNSYTLSFSIPRIRPRVFENARYLSLPFSFQSFPVFGVKRFSSNDREATPRAIPKRTKRLLDAAFLSLIVSSFSSLLARDQRPTRNFICDIE